MIYLDPRYSNYWLDQAREEERRKQKDKKKKDVAKNKNLYDMLDTLVTYKVKNNIKKTP